MSEKQTVYTVVTTVPGFMSSAEIISKLRAEFHGVTYDVSTPTGMAKAVEARRKLREARVALDKKKPEVKREALDFCNKVEADYKMLRAAVSEYEDIPDAAIKAEEERKEEIKREKERQAAEAQKVLDGKILEIAKLPLRCSGQSAEWVGEFLAKLEAKEIGGEFTGETRTRAEQAKAEAVSEIKTILAALVEAAEEARVAVIRGAINAIKVLADQAQGLSIQYLTEKLADLEVMPIGEDFFQEFRAEAQDAKIDAIQVLTDELNEKTAAAKELEQQQAKLAEQQRIQVEKEEVFRKEQEAFRKEQERINAERAEADRIEREKQEAIAAEERRKQEEALAAEREKERLAAIEAEKKRVEAERERKAAENARKLAEAKCKDASTAFKKILDICNDMDNLDIRTDIALIAEANI